jgi:hypothetical protein
MFRSRTTRRRNRPDSTVRTRRPFISRQLRVELMEGRLMLSATALNGLASPAGNTLTGAQVSLVSQPAEGGFINADVATMATRSHGVFSTAGEVAIVFSDIPVTDQLSPAGASQGTGFNDYSPIDGNGLQPVAMTLLSNDGVFQATFNPIVAEPTGSVSGPHEGGSIPIHLILADLRSDVGFASNGKSVTFLAAEKSVDSLVSARRISTSDSAIAGEWARAMVFEIAGGEPGTSGVDSLHEPRRTTSGSEETLKRSEPLSSVESQQDGVTRATRQDAAAQASEDSSGNGQATQQSARSAGSILAAANPPNLSTAVQMTASGKLPTNSSASNGNPAITAAATAIVFDHLGEGNAAVIESSVDGKSWVRSIGTSPLLMVLALERIAALNSRRATRESRVAAAKKPLRLRS